MKTQISKQAAMDIIENALKQQELCKERKELMTRLKDVTAQIKMADMAGKIKTTPYGNYPSPFKQIMQMIINKKKLEAHWQKTSMAIGLEIQNQNQYDLALMGASQEIIDTNVPAYVYELFLRQGK